VDAWAIVVAGGSGARFGRPKQYELLAGRPLIEWSCLAARRSGCGVILVLPVGDTATGGRNDRWDADLLVEGGSTRSASVRAGLGRVPPDAAVVVVHDAARPLAEPAMWARVIDAVRAGADGAVPAVAVTDTVKLVEPGGSLTTLDRSRLVAVQTPQAFATAALQRAHVDEEDATDDAALVERHGGRVVVVAGAATNVKVTTPADLTVAAALVEAGHAAADMPSAPEGTATGPHR
jgi:2-C-methyl-D-erythritol 4-phosphate cytidylyltransferase